MGRVVDICVAVVALVLLSPVLLLLALLIVIDSPGLPLYQARRTGRNGVEFRMLKFRTMIPGADRLGAITGPSDRRVTRLGAILRRTKLDELPQFINLLRGDLTLVGPRPEAPEIVERYTQGQRVVLRVKPGITGCVQLEAANEADQIPVDSRTDDYYIRYMVGPKVSRDLEYLKIQTPWTDARIVFATAALVIRSLVHR